MASGIDRVGALEKAFEFVYKSEIEGDYCEFGVYQGVSILRALRADENWKRKTGRVHVDRFFGFDSFQGLPDFTDQDLLAEYGVFKPGQFNDTSMKIIIDRLVDNDMPMDRVTLIPGYYADTLAEDKTLQQLEGRKFAIVHVDCDLYSSASLCLSFLNERLVDGAVLLFDDWFCYRGRPDRGVHRAFDEWHSKCGYVASKYFTYSWAGQAFIVSLNEE